MVRIRRFLAVFVAAGFMIVGPLRAEDPVRPAADHDVKPLPVDPGSSLPGLGTGGDGDRPSLVQFGPMPLSPSASAGEEVDCNTSGVVAHADWLLWRASPQGLDFATIANPAAAAAGGGPLATESLDFGRTNGIRAGVGYRFTTGWELLWDFTYFDSDAQQKAVSSVGAATVLLATHSFFNTTPMDSISAAGTFRLNLHDVDVSWGSCLNETVDFRAFGGFRYAKIDEEFDTAYAYHLNPATPVTGTIHMPLGMESNGIRIGAEFQWNTAGGLRVFGRAAQSILVADFETRRVEADSFHGPILDIPGNASRVVPVVEAAAGISWRLGPLEASGGYEMSNWFNMVDASLRSQSLFIDGCFVRLAYVH